MSRSEISGLISAKYQLLMPRIYGQDWRARRAQVSSAWRMNGSPPPAAERGVAAAAFTRPRRCPGFVGSANERLRCLVG